MMLPILHLKRILPESWRSRLRFITRRLPRRWFYMTNDRRFWWLTGETEAMQKRPRLVRYELQEGCFLETYLNDQTSADGSRYFGSAACLVVHGSDILRFDCLGQPRLLRDGLVAAYGFTYLPWRLMRSLRGTPQGIWLIGLRVVVIGLARAAGMLWAHVAGAGDSAVKISADLAPK